MFCPNCGSENQDNALTCSQCGTVFTPAVNTTPKLLLGKKEYFSTIASDKAKKLRKIALIVGIVCLVFTIATAFIVNNSSIFNIPIFGMVVEDFDEVEEQYEDLLDEYEDLDKDEIEEIEDELDMDFDEIEDILENPSLSNFEHILKLMDEDESVEAIAIFKTIIIIYAFFIAFFQLLAVLLKKGGFAIAAIIVSILYFVLFAGMLMFVIFLVLNIAQIVMYSMANKEYKAYKSNLLNQF